MPPTAKLTPPAPDIQVAPATDHDVDAVLALRDDAARWLLRRAINQWQPGEVPRTLIAARIAAGQVFVVRRQAEPEQLLGTVTITWSDELTWGQRDEDAGYVHLLIVSRALRGSGAGRWLLNWAERHVAHAGKPLVRLDCVRANPTLRQWHERAGYQQVGEREYDAPPWAAPVALLEKNLRGMPSGRPQAPQSTTREPQRS